MNEELQKDKENEQNDLIKKQNFYNESETIAKYLIEKLISLVISTDFRKEVEKRISNYCISDVTTQLNDIKDLEFLSHDNDDFIKKRTILEYNSKTPLKDRNKYKDFFILNKEDIINQLNNSEHIKGYELIKDLDPNISVEYSIDLNHLLPVKKNHYYYDHEKIFMRILKRKKGNKLKLDNNNLENFRRNTNSIEPFTISKFEQIEKIDKIETIKIDDNNIPIFNKMKSSVIKIEKRPNKNFWGEIKQPKGDKVDRDAATKIKYDNKTFTNNLFEIPEDNEKHEMIISKNIDNINDNTKTKEKTTKMDKNHKITKKKDLYSSKALLDKKQKKIRVIPIELPSYDLESEKTNNIEEPYIQKMRRDIEIEINKRKREELLEQKEKENKEKQKYLNNKPKRILNGNVTVDIKGKIVYIRPIKYESLINEFKNMRSTSKDVAEIKDDTIIDKKFDNVTVIKNNMADLLQNNNNNSEKSGKIGRNTSTTNNSKSELSLKNNKNEKNKEITKTPDRNRMKFASGSNFEIINLECGVNLIENQKIKTGGKDFFRKYGRCSFEVFQEQLNRTSSDYFHNDNNNYINVNINDNENDSNIKSDIKQDNSGLPYILKKKFKKEKSDYDILNTMPNTSNNYLNLKTTNLKAALNNLDLINEDRLREFAMKNEDKNNNILNNTKDKKLEKKDYGEINKFNKTLLKNKLWGEPTDSFHTQYMSRIFPIKPDQKYLLKNLSKNDLNHSPRKRLPPLATTQRAFGAQIDKNDFGKNIKSKRPIKKKLIELKNKNLSKDDIYNNKRKNFFSTTNSYYNNTEKGLSPIK